MVDAVNSLTIILILNGCGTRNNILYIVSFLFLLTKFLSVYSVSPGEIKLEIPTINLDADVSQLAANQAVVQKLEQCVMNWQTQITSVIEEQQKKKPQVRLGH